MYFSNAQIYRDHHNYSINITAVKIFSTENPVTLKKYYRNICSFNLWKLTLKRNGKSNLEKSYTYPCSLSLPFQLSFGLHDPGKETRWKYIGKHILGFWACFKALCTDYFRDFSGIILIKKRFYPKSWLEDLSNRYNATVKWNYYVN